MPGRQSAGELAPRELTAPLLQGWQPSEGLLAVELQVP
jgi:hypothetical protein